MLIPYNHLQVRSLEVLVVLLHDSWLEIEDIKLEFWFPTITHKLEP